MQVTTILLAPARPRRDGHRDCIGRGCADVLECDHHEAPPDGGAFLRKDRVRGSLRSFDFASTDGPGQKIRGRGSGSLEAILDPTKLAEELSARELFPELDKLHDPLGEPPPEQRWF